MADLKRLQRTVCLSD